MALKNFSKALFLFTIIWMAAPTRASTIHSFAEQFTAKELEARSERRPPSKAPLEGITKGLKETLLSEKEEERAEDSFVLKQITLKGNKVFSEEDLHFIYKEQLYNLTNLNTLKKIAQKISDFYRKNGYILTRASVPSQDIMDGDAEILIHEKGLAHMSFEGDMKPIDHLKERVHKKLMSSSPLRLQDMQTEMNLLRAAGDVIVYPELRPIEENPKDAELILRIKANPPKTDIIPEVENATFYLERIQLEGNEAIATEDLEALFQKDLGTSITENQLHQIVGRISAFYRAQGFMLSRAFLPKQTIEDGVVRITVREGTLNKVTLLGDIYQLKPEAVQEVQEAIQTDKPFHLKDLTGYITLVQQLGHFHVYPKLKPLQNSTKADLDFTLHAMAPEEIQETLKEKVTLPNKFTLQEIQITGNTAFTDEELLDLLKPHIGKNITLQDVGEMTQLLTRFYRREGYILSQAILPPQDVIDGVVKIKIIEGFIGDIIFEGDTNDLEDFLADAARSIKTSRPLHMKDLERHLLALKDLPHLIVTSTMRPGQHVKHSSTLVVTLEKRYWDGSISANNYGNKSIGPIQATAMLSVSSPLNSTHKINVSGSKSYDPKELRLLQAGYTLPLGTRGAKLTLDTMASRSKPSTDGLPVDLKNYGTEDRIGVSTSVPLVRGRYHNLFLNAGFTARNVESTSLNETSNSMDRIRKASLGLLLDFSDALQGVNILRLEGVKGVPLFGTTARTSGRKSIAKANPRFSLVNYFISREQFLGGPFSLYGMVHGQKAFSTLLSSERFRGGGMPYNKAYANSALTGDSGMEGKVELRYSGTMDDFIKHYMFYTYFSQMKTWNREPDYGEKNSERARGLGVGARATFYGGPTLEFEYGRPLSNVVGGNRVKPKFLMGLSYSLNTV